MELKKYLNGEGVAAIWDKVKERSIPVKYLTKDEYDAINPEEGVLYVVVGRGPSIGDGAFIGFDTDDTLIFQDNVLRVAFPTKSISASDYDKLDEMEKKSDTLFLLIPKTTNIFAEIYDVDFGEDGKYLHIKGEDEVSIRCYNTITIDEIIDYYNKVSFPGQMDGIRLVYNKATQELEMYTREGTKEEFILSVSDDFSHTNENLIKNPPGKVGAIQIKYKEKSVLEADTVGFSNAQTGMEAVNVQEAIDQLFTSVADGKSLIASAISDKGIDTSADATFEQMATNISEIKSSSAPEGLFKIDLTVDPPEAGTVRGKGYASEGVLCTVEADAISAPEDWSFGAWEEDGKRVSIESRYSFGIDKDRFLTARFFDGPPKYVLGRDWFETTLPRSARWLSITYGNGKFVTVAENSNIAAYSTDGINWTQTTLPVSNSLYSITYGNGKFVTVTGSNIVAYSTDGINWTQTTLPVSANWFSVTYGDGKFVTVAYNSNVAAYSTDGINWTQTTLPVSAKWQSVTYGDGKFVTVAYGSNIVAYSTDGITWTQTTLPVSADWQSVTYGNGKFVTVNGNSNSNIAAYSTDGINWTQTTLPVSNSLYSITYGNGKFVTVAYGFNIAAYSTDGINWTQTTLPVSANWRSVTYGNGKFVTVASYSTIAAISLTTNYPPV